MVYSMSHSRLMVIQVQVIFTKASCIVARVKCTVRVITFPEFGPKRTRAVNARYARHKCKRNGKTVALIRHTIYLKTTCRRVLVKKIERKFEAVCMRSSPNVCIGVEAGNFKSVDIRTSRLRNNVLNIYYTEKHY